MADPGFPVGGAPTRWGGTNLRHIHFSAKTYAKMKEIDPVGGARAGGAPWIRQWPTSEHYLCICTVNLNKMNRTMNLEGKD